MDTVDLLAAARAARMRAYAPYSRFMVGAALLTEEKAVITGANIENASYGLTVCAERQAMMTAVHAGYKKFKKIALFSDSSPPAVPCGACRQVLWELGGNLEIILGNQNSETSTVTLLELLPQPFGVNKWAEIGLEKKAYGREEMWRLPVSFHPVGYVDSDYHEPGAIPENYRELLCRVVILPEMEEGLYRLEEEERINIISYLHRAGGYVLKEGRSGRGGEVYGVFACRAPLRPNSIAQTTVELVERNRNILVVRGADLLNGTPVLDIKTVLPDGR